MSFTKYVLGLMFSLDGKEIVLLRKSRGPEFLIGRLNAIGGHHEEGESAVEGVRREFEEETGIVTEVADWTHFTTLGNDTFSMDCFYTFSAQHHTARTTTEEEVGVYALASLVDDMLAPDMPQLIEKARIDYALNRDSTRFVRDGFARGGILSDSSPGLHPMPRLDK